MKPHPRIRKTIKWGGAVVTLLLVVVWVGSGWRGYAWDGSKGGLGVRAGRVLVSYLEVERASTGLSRAESKSFQCDWWFSGVSVHGIGQMWWIPLWIPITATLMATSVAWRLDTLARRRARLNLCPSCNYDRTGLASGAKCPECGTVPASV